MEPITLTIIGGLVVVVISGTASYAFGKFRGKEEFQKTCEANIIEYSKMLQKIIGEANKAAKSDFEIFVRKAQAIVAQRDDFKNDLDDMSNLLNSDIDELAELTSIKDEKDLREAETKMRRLVSVIHDKWPGKGPLIASKMRALLAKWGIFKQQ